MWKRMGAWCALSRSRWTTGIGRAIGLVALVAGFLALLAGASPAAAPILHQPKPTATPQSPGIAIATAQLDLPDPYLFDDGGTYDLFISTALGDQDQHIPVMSGSPGHWSAPIDAVPALPDWASASAGQAGLAWTPAVYKLGGRYLMYFAPTLAVTDHHCLAVGASTSATGKYLVAPAPIVCQWNEGGDIDPQLLVDPKGPDGPGHPNYLIWKSDNNSVTTAGVPMIWAAPLSNDGLRLTGDPVKIFQPGEPWQESLVEAPQMVINPDGEVWLFYSAGQGYFSANYSMGAARCAGPLGPCIDVNSKPLITSNAQGSGPGEETYFVGPDGSDWLLYSAAHFGALYQPYRAVEAARIGWNKAGPYVAQAGAFPSP